MARKKRCNTCGEKEIISNLHICTGPKKFKCFFCGIILKNKSVLQNHKKKVHKRQNLMSPLMSQEPKCIQEVMVQDTGMDEIFDLKKTFEKRNEVETVLNSLKDVILINPNFQEVIEAYAKVCVEDQIKSSEEILITLLGELEGNGWDDSKSFMETLPLRLRPEAEGSNFMSYWLSENSFVFSDDLKNENKAEHINLWAKIIRKLVPTRGPSKREKIHKNEERRRQKWLDEQEKVRQRVRQRKHNDDIKNSVKLQQDDSGVGPDLASQEPMDTSGSVSQVSAEASDLLTSNENIKEIITSKEIQVNDNETPVNNDDENTAAINEDEKLEQGELIDEENDEDQNNSNSDDCIIIGDLRSGSDDHGGAGRDDRGPRDFRGPKYYCGPLYDHGPPGTGSWRDRECKKNAKWQQPKNRDDDGPPPRRDFDRPPRRSDETRDRCQEPRDDRGSRDRDYRGPRDYLGLIDDRGARNDRSSRDRDDRSPQDFRGPRDYRGPRDDRGSRDRDDRRFERRDDRGEFGHII